MLYALPQEKITKLRNLSFRPEFTGAEMLHAVFRSDPAVIAQILPKPLKPAKEPLAAVFVARYPNTNFGCVYNEGALFIQTRFRGEAGFYCLAMPVDDDMAMVGGREHYGFPKKMAEEITLEQKDDRWVGRVVRKGVELMRIESAPSEPVGDRDLDFLGPVGRDPDGRTRREATSFLFKYFPSPHRRGFDYLPRIVRQVTAFRPRADLLTGPGEVVLNSSPYDPFGVVKVEEVLTCVCGTWDNSMLPGRVVGRIWNPWRFLPHALFKTDAVPFLLGEV